MHNKNYCPFKAPEGRCFCARLSLLLVIPKKHIPTLVELQAEDTELMGHVVFTASRLADKLGLSEEGFRLVSNCKEAGGQTVFHIHVHLIGGRQLQWPPG